MTISDNNKSVEIIDDLNDQADNISNGNSQSDPFDIDNKNFNASFTNKQIINWIKSRRSIGNLNGPPPTDAQVEEAIKCAMTAPDHKKLQPWRFIIVKGNARNELGDVFVQSVIAKAEREGEVMDEKTIQKTAAMPLRAPMIIAVVTRMQYHPKVPHFEQVLSTGAAVQNLILALKAQGFNTVWRTGLLANESPLKSYFNVGSEDYVAAFVYVGQSDCNFPPRHEIDIDGFVKYQS